MWEGEVYFKLRAISPEQSAAGQFTSRMNNAHTLSRGPRRCQPWRIPVAHLWRGEREVRHLDNGAAGPKGFHVVMEPRRVRRERGTRRRALAPRGVQLHITR